LCHSREGGNPVKNCNAVPLPFKGGKARLLSLAGGVFKKVFVLLDSRLRRNNNGKGGNDYKE